jgi:inosine-uridine nucleoside N-ribohydrolase
MTLLKTPWKTPWRGAACLLAMTGMLLAAVPAAAQDDVTSVIVDTDAGPDDFMALAFLLSSTRVRVEAVTITTGLAHGDAGAANVLRLLQLAGRGDVPVYIGRETPLAGTRSFPEDWRRLADELPGVEMPEAKRKVGATPAHEFLAARLGEARAVTVLALGGLTNLAEAFRLNPAAAKTIDRLVIMGGAIKVPGNLEDGGIADNTTAEWNFYVDPEAARRVFLSGASIRLVPLDATQKVAIDRQLQRQLQTSQRPLGRVVTQVLATVDDLIDQGTLFAWDPLAAASIVDEDLLRFTRISIEIRQEAPEEGRTVAATRGPANADVAFEVNPRRFVDLFTRTLGVPVRPN